MHCRAYNNCEAELKVLKKKSIDRELASKQTSQEIATLTAFLVNYEIDRFEFFCNFKGVLEKLYPESNQR